MTTSWLGREAPKVVLGFTEMSMLRARATRSAGVSASAMSAKSPTPSSSRALSNRLSTERPKVHREAPEGDALQVWMTCTSTSVTDIAKTYTLMYLQW